MSTVTITARPQATRRRARRAAGLALNLLDRTLTALLVALAVAVVLLMALAALGTRPRLEMSDSMAPALRAGDVIWLKGVRARDVRVGDVVAIEDAERHRVLVHRARAIHADRLGRVVVTTRGDANTTSESWTLRADARLGRYGGLRLPAVGRLTSRLDTGTGGVVELVSLVTLGGLALRRIWRP